MFTDRFRLKELWMKRTLKQLTTEGTLAKTIWEPLSGITWHITILCSSLKKAKKKRTCIDQQISQSQSYNKPTLGFHYFERQCFQEINQIMKIFEKNDTSSVKKFTRVIYI